MYNNILSFNINLVLKQFLHVFQGQNVACLLFGPVEDFLQIGKIFFTYNFLSSKTKFLHAFQKQYCLPPFWPWKWLVYKLSQYLYTLTILSLFSLPNPSATALPFEEQPSSFAVSSSVKWKKKLIDSRYKFKRNFIFYKMEKEIDW